MRKEESKIIGASIALRIRHIGGENIENTREYEYLMDAVDEYLPLLQEDD